MTTSEQVNPEALSDPFEKLVRILSELPTDKAMKDLAKNRLSPEVRKVIETMAIEKIDLMKAIVFLVKREKIMSRMVEMHYKTEELAQFSNLDWSTVKISFNADQEN